MLEKDGETHQSQLFLRISRIIGVFARRRLGLKRFSREYSHKSTLSRYKPKTVKEKLIE